MTFANVRDIHFHKDNLLKTTLLVCIFVYFFSGDLHVVLDVSEDGRLDEEADLAVAVTPRDTLGSLRLARLNVAHDLGEHLCVNLENVENK